MLAHTIQKAGFIPASAFLFCSKDGGQNRIFASSDVLGKYEWWYFTPGVQLRKELEKCYLPGGYHVKFFRRNDGTICVGFYAESILTSVYAGMTPEEYNQLKRYWFA